MEENEMNYEEKYKEALEIASRKHKIMVEQGSTLAAGLLEEIFPELAESEDERIRVVILKLVLGMRDEIFTTVDKLVTKPKVLAWLKKHKEEEGYEAIPVESTLEYKLGFKAGKESEKQKEQKSAEYTLQSSWGTTNEQKPMGWKPQAESLEALMYAVEGHWDMIKPTSYLSRRLEDLYKGLVNTFNVDESYLRKLSEVAYTTDDIEELKALKDKIEASMEKKPVEPSDFKTKLAEYLQNNSPKDGKYVISSESILEMAKEELIKRGVVQKPAEWSEEDEKVYDYLKGGFEYATDNPDLLKSQLWGKSDATILDYRNFIDKLKSLRPQPKVELSEDVKKTLDEVSHILIGLNYKQVAKDYKQAIEKLLYSCPSWKPSEEQMEALDIIVKYGDKESSHIKCLRELYEQLKKLI